MSLSLISFSSVEMLNMVVIKDSDEFTLRIGTQRLFKLFTESYAKLQQILPTVIESVELHQGDGGVGTIRTINFVKGNPCPYSKTRVDAVDHQKHTIKYTLIEAAALLDDKLESIEYETSFEDAAGGGDRCIVKILSKYHINGDDHVASKEEDIKQIKEKNRALYMLTDEYLLANPHFCA